MKISQMVKVFMKHKQFICMEVNLIDIYVSVIGF